MTPDRGGTGQQSREEQDRFAWRDDLEASDDEMASVAWTVVIVLSAIVIGLTLVVYFLW